MPEWDEHQEETAEFFRSIGLEADTNITLQGVRTSHDIDVVVRSNLFGFDLLWVIECKYWKEAVSKLHVLATLAELRLSTGSALGMARLRAVQDRVLESRDRYWNLGKSVRIDHGLRPEAFAYGYSANVVLNAIEAALFSAFAQRIPVVCPHPIDWIAIEAVDDEIFAAKNSLELSERLEPLIVDLENRLDSAYEAIEREQDK